jgi:predicted alpha/beta hydrolase family esterase
MKQVVVIHGGDAFPSYDAYLVALKNWDVDLSDFKRSGDWKSTLAEVLGPNYQVLMPQMPNKQNAKYIEWKIWFEKLIPFLIDGVVLVGHSLGATFLAKYLSEEHFPKTIAGTILIAPPYDMDENRSVVEFVLPQSLLLLAEQAGKIVLYHSENDSIVSFSELAKYRAALPHATVRIFKDRGHFNQVQFPELIADIKTL